MVCYVMLCDSEWCLVMVIVVCVCFFLSYYIQKGHSQTD